MTIVLAIAALVPAMGLALYIYLRDRVEKEPVGLLFALLGAGAGSVIPVLLISLLTEPLIEVLFGGYVTEAGRYLYNAVEYFIGVALIEEACKWGAMVLLTRKSRHFNSTFDGIVYAVFVSLGFAALENLLYVFQSGLGVALARAVTAVPGHMFFGVLMGFYYSRFKVRSTANALERAYAIEGRITLRQPPISGKQDLLLAVFVPVLAHGFYDFALAVGSTLFIILCLLFLAFLYGYCFQKVRRMARADGGILLYAKALVFHKYHLTGDVFSPTPATVLQASQES